MQKNKIKIIAISGSLRANSSNARLLQAIEKRVPDKVELFIYKGISALPQFDDSNAIPVTVSVWRQHLQDADGVLICSPEYAFGIPGSLKNAIDWTVGSGELVNKPLGLITAATGGEKAHAAWLQVFAALSANIPANGALLISSIRTKLNTAGEITDPATLQAVNQVMEALLLAATQQASLGR